MPNGQALQMVMFHAFKARDAIMEAQIGMAAQSIHTHYPDAVIVLLTNLLGAEADVPSFVEVRAGEVDLLRIMLERARCYTEFVRASAPDTKIVFLDTDMLVIRRFGEILRPGADLAVTVRMKPSAPINGGLIIVDTTRFAEVTAFFEQFLACCSRLSPEEQRWECDQTALRILLDPPVKRLNEIEEVVRGDLQVRFAPTQIFNHTPYKLLLSLGLFRFGARILHFKGARKSRMPAYFRRFLSSGYVRFIRIKDRKRYLETP